jgi:hypothetical protein
MQPPIICALLAWVCASFGHVSHYGWRTFLKTHMRDLVSLDFFVVPTVTYRVLFVLLILAHERRPILPPEHGHVIAVPEVVALHHHYERQAA